jgi:hypothetical protein
MRLQCPRQHAELVRVCPDYGILLTERSSAAAGHFKYGGGKLGRMIASHRSPTSWLLCAINNRDGFEGAIVFTINRGPGDPSDNVCLVIATGVASIAAAFSARRKLRQSEVGSRCSVWSRVLH